MKLLADIVVPTPSGALLPCAVVLSPRARHVRVRLAADGALALLVPPSRKLSPAEAVGIVQDALPWIEKALHRLALRQAQEPQAHVLRVPERLDLPSLGECWQVHCLDGPANSTRDRVSLRVGEADKHLMLRGSVHNIPLCCRVLQQWLMGYATAYLSQRVYALAARDGFTVNQVRVRGQKTRWGSCSELGNINVNYRLIVLEQPLIDYLILHELCHLRHMNHSAAYKACLQSYEPQWKKFEQALTRAWRELPPWIVQHC
ncbi:MAG: M48 family metallopeptidase [Desulfovibrionaceae bacterium]